MNNIPLIIPTYNQPTYLKNLILWWRWYNKGDVYIVDNDSSNPDLLDFYRTTDAKVIMTNKNEAWKNLEDALKLIDAEYFVISPADIMPHPSVPPNFLQIWKHMIDEYDYHHVGFQLRISDTTMDNHMIEQNELQFWDESRKLLIPYKGTDYTAYKAPVDSTFALYKTWEPSPMRPEWWDNSLRMFEAFHLPWHLETVNKEMDYYFKTCKKAVTYVHDTGVNYYHPKEYE